MRCDGRTDSVSRPDMDSTKGVRFLAKHRGQQLWEQISLHASASIYPWTRNFLRTIGTLWISLSLAIKRPNTVSQYSLGEHTEKYGITFQLAGLVILLPFQVFRVDGVIQRYDALLLLISVDDKNEGAVEWKTLHIRFRSGILRHPTTAIEQRFDPSIHLPRQGFAHIQSILRELARIIA